MRPDFRWAVVGCSLVFGFGVDSVTAAPESKPAVESRVRSGHLIIAGGGEDWTESPAVYEGIKARIGKSGKTIGILPTATSVPEEATKELVDSLTAYLGPNRLEIIDITTTTSARAAEDKFAKLIRSKRLVYFIGGDQSRIVRTFRPKLKPEIQRSAVAVPTDSTDEITGYRALIDVLKKGGTISGSSAGAAMMCDPMLTGGTSARALRKGATTTAPPDDDDYEPPGVGLGRGMGFFPYGLVDQHFLVRGRLGRLIVAMEETSIPLGFGVEQNCGMDVDLATGQIDTLGTCALTLVDLQQARREGAQRSGIRLSIVGSHGTVDGESGKVTAPAGSRPVPAGYPAAELPESAWKRGGVYSAVEQLAIRPIPSSVELPDDDLLVRFSSDKETRFWVTEETNPKRPVVGAAGVLVEIFSTKP